jgi:hypothetical protein
MWPSVLFSRSQSFARAPAWLFRASTVAVLLIVPVEVIGGFPISVRAL